MLLRRRDRLKLRQMQQQLAEAAQGLLGLCQAMERLDKHKDNDKRTPAENGAKLNGLDKRHYVLSLAGRGLNCRQIAERLRIPRGEVELFLSLERLRAPSDEKIQRRGAANCGLNMGDFRASRARGEEVARTGANR